MKKALVVFLILAVAGGLFAQATATFTGQVQTGLAVGFTDEDGDAGKPVVDFIRNRGEQGIRAQVTANIAGENSYGKWGGAVTLRVRETAIFGSDGIAPVNAPNAELFWQPNSLLWIQIGTAGPAGWGTGGGIDRSLDILDNNGLKLRLTPIDGLSLVGHAFYGAQGAPKLFEDVNYGFGARYAVPSLLTVTANARYLAQNKDDKTEKLQAGAGVNFTALSGMGLSKIAADFGTFGLGTDDFFLGIGEAVNFVAGDLTLGAKFGQYIWMGEGSKDVLPMYFHGEVAYNVSSAVTVGIQGRYLLGGKGNFGSNWREAGEFGGVDNVAAFSGKDVAALNISPVITFNVGPQILLGYNLALDLSDGATGKTQTNLIYAGVNVSF